MEEEQMLTKEQILDMLDAGQYKELKEELGNMYPVDIADPQHSQASLPGHRPYRPDTSLP